MKNITYIIGFILIALMVTTPVLAQVGINNPTPNSTFDIETIDVSNTTGLLMPTIDAFPAINPGALQDGMLVFLRSPRTNHKKGHYYWNNSASEWKIFAGEWVDGYNTNSDKLTYLKQAYKEQGQDVVIMDNGRMGMGTDNPTESLEIRLPGDNDIQISSNGSQPNAPNIIYYTKGGSFSSPNYLSDNKPVTSIAGTAWTGTGESDILGSVTSYTDGNHSNNNLPTQFKMSVTGSGDDNEEDNGVEMVIRASGKIGIGTENPTANLHIKAGTSAPNSAPIKFNAGTNLASPEKGAIEFDGSHLYFTDKDKDRRMLAKGLSRKSILNFPNIASKNSIELTVSVTGAEVGSSCDCGPQGSIENGLKWSCYVSAANVAKIRLSNISNSAIDPALKAWEVTVLE